MGKKDAKPRKYALLRENKEQTWPALSIVLQKEGWGVGELVPSTFGLTAEIVECIFEQEYTLFLDLCFELELLNERAMFALEIALSALLTKGRGPGKDLLTEARDICRAAAAEEGSKNPDDDEDVQDINHLIRIIDLLDNANRRNNPIASYRQQLDAVLMQAVTALQVKFK